MRKHDSFRRAIEEAFPKELSRDPDLLSVFVDQGRIGARFGPIRDFEYRYRLIGILEGFAGDVDYLVATILEWIRAEQPDRLQNHEEDAFDFEAVILDGNRVDVEIGIDIEEAVAVALTPAGIECTAAPDPELAGEARGDNVAIDSIVVGGEGLLDHGR